ncbi:hypothetical protein BYT27DRAFT_7339962 [Phlegmacium glaucopus]|nr:hypothetical protein BYT27DRAFT_7339962 [Phlegmacium glaucopus]
MTSTPGPTITMIIIHGNIHITRTTGSFNDTNVQVTLPSESTESTGHDTSSEAAHTDTPPLVHSRVPAQDSAEIPHRMSAEGSLTHGHLYYPPTPTHAEATGRTKGSDSMKDMWKQIVDIVGRIRGWLLEIFNRRG